jgi:hypothetical protein
VLIDVSSPELVAAWTAAMEAHATQTSARNYVELQLTRARLLGARAGVAHAIALFPNEPLVFESLAQRGAGRGDFDMDSGPPLKIGITCYPSVGGSGILASTLGEDLARRGHEVHFISYERPFRMPADAPRLFFHPVVINDYGLFKYPDYTLPLSVKMAEVSRDHRWTFFMCITRCLTPPPRFLRARCCRRSNSRASSPPCMARTPRCSEAIRATAPPSTTR